MSFGRVVYVSGYQVCVCVCACVYTCACVRACVHVCVAMQSSCSLNFRLEKVLFQK